MTMHALVPVFIGTFQNQQTQFCNARDLHAVLGVGRDFTNWIKGRIEEYGFVEGEDYSPNLARIPGRRGQPRTDYHLTIDMAKELAMIENNDKGRQVRRYFIAMEKKARGPAFDLRATMLADNSTPTVALPGEVQTAINRKAWAMAHDAYELCREYLARRVAFTCEVGVPRRINEARAHLILAEATLDEALAPAYHNRLHEVLLGMELVADTSQMALAKMRDEINGMTK